MKENIKAPRHWLCAGNWPGPVNSPHKGPVTRKMFPFDDVIMNYSSPSEQVLDPALVDIWRKVTRIWSTNLRCTNAQSPAEVKRQHECSEEWIAELVCLNRMLVSILKVIRNMDHVPCIWVLMPFVCGIEIGTQHKITSKSSVESSAPIAAQLPLLVLRSIQLMTGEPRPRYSTLHLLGESGVCAQDNQQVCCRFSLLCLGRGWTTCPLHCGPILGSCF